MDLQDDNKSLKSVGLKLHSKVLLLCSSPARTAQLRQQEQVAKEADSRDAHLQRLKHAAASLARRETRSGGCIAGLCFTACGPNSIRGCTFRATQHACRHGSDDAFEFALENQSGDMLKLNKADREAVVMALILHEKAKKKLQLEQYSEALPELLLAEEAANLCMDDLIKSTDNNGILMLDIVW